MVGNPEVIRDAAKLVPGSLMSRRGLWKVEWTDSFSEANLLQAK
jgi:hypothetical protein